MRCLDGAHADEVLRVAWSGDAAHLATGGADGVAKLWRVGSDPTADWPCVAALEHGEGKQIYALQYLQQQQQQQPAGDTASEGQLLLTAVDDTVALWDVGVEELAQSWTFPTVGCGPGHGGAKRNPDETVDVFDVAVSPTTSAEAASAPGGGREGLLAVALGDGSVRVLDRRSPSLVALLEAAPGASAAVTGACFSPSGDELVSCATDGCAMVWDCRAWGAARHTLQDAAGKGQPLFGCLFWPAGGTDVLLWSSSGALVGYDAADARRLGSHTCVSQKTKGRYPVFDVAVASGGTHVAAVGGLSEQQADAGSSGWGVPSQLWQQQSAVSDEASDAGAKRAADGASGAPRAVKRPKAEGSKPGATGLGAEGDLSWLA